MVTNIVGVSYRHEFSPDTRSIPQQKSEIVNPVARLHLKGPRCFPKGQRRVVDPTAVQPHAEAPM